MSDLGGARTAVEERGEAEAGNGAGEGGDAAPPAGQPISKASSLLNPELSSFDKFPARVLEERGESLTEQCEEEVDTFSLRFRPQPELGPTRVEIHLIFDKWKVHADPSGERLTVKMRLFLIWKDERIKGLHLCRRSGVVPQDIWHPTLMNMGSFGGANLTKDGITVHNMDRGELQMCFDILLNEDADDHAPDSRRLMAFPFDSMRYTFYKCLSDEVSLHTDKDIDANWHIKGEDWLQTGVEDRVQRENTVLWNSSTSSGEHNLTAVSYAIGTHTSLNNGNTYVDFAFSLHVERDITFYVNKVFMPLFSIYAFATMVYFFPPNELEARLMLVTTMFLTLFAIQWTVMDRLPRTPHSTVVDEVVWNLIMGLLTISFGNCIAFRLDLEDNDGGVGDDDPGWTYSRASKVDAAFLAFSLGCIVLRGLYVIFVTRQRCRRGGCNQKAKDGIGFIRNLQPMKGRVWRYVVSSRKHVAVDDPNDF